MALICVVDYATMRVVHIPGQVIGAPAAQTPALVPPHECDFETTMPAELDLPVPPDQEKP